jgi:hypothetical protein
MDTKREILNFYIKDQQITEEKQTYYEMKLAAGLAAI